MAQVYQRAIVVDSQLRIISGQVGDAGGEALEALCAGWSQLAFFCAAKCLAEGASQMEQLSTTHYAPLCPVSYSQCEPVQCAHCTAYGTTCAVVTHM
eukprot:6187089-Pleurochrysis_carterae.AAC.4